jgi:hypothetical protein
MPLCSWSWQIVDGRARKAATIRVNPERAKKEGILRALLACQAQNRTTIPSKSGDGGHTLRLTGTATTTQSVNSMKTILSLERKVLMTSWANIGFLK